VTRPSEKIRIVVADDHPLFRQGVIATLEAAGDIEVVGQASDAAGAVRAIRQLLPDVALLDVSMPGGGIQAAREIASACPVVKVMMLTVSESEDDVLRALQSGARGYILKGVAAGDLVHVVRQVNGGESYVTPALAAGLLTELRGDRRRVGAAHLYQELTERERQILELVAKGQSNKEVARELDLAEKTVKHHMTNVLEKLQVRNRVEAALLARDIAAQRV
jgi:DNA-binding NarL/FixJ family response regulator